MSTPIKPDRLEAIKKMGICSPAIAWLETDGRTVEDLAEHPEWAFLNAKYYGGDVAQMQAIVLEHGSAELRRKFADHVAGADRAALLARFSGAERFASLPTPQRARATRRQGPA